jgi:hypothetical protein
MPLIAGLLLLPLFMDGNGVADNAKTIPHLLKAKECFALECKERKK